VLHRIAGRPQRRPVHRAILGRMHGWVVLRHLVNCVLVLRVRLPEIKLFHVIEREWTHWLVLSNSAAEPPAAPKAEPYELFPE
jgi:hypothetical protein